MQGISIHLTNLFYFAFIKSPAEKVVLLCSKNLDGDIDNILAHIDTEEFHVDVKKKDKTDGKITFIAISPHTTNI